MDSPQRAAPSPHEDGTATVRSDLDEVSLLVAAESRINTAMLTTHGVANATIAQATAIKELREAREAIRVLRDRLGRTH